MCSTGPGGYSPARALRSPMSLGIRRTRYNPDMSNNPQQKRRGWAIPALPLGLLAALLVRRLDHCHRKRATVVGELYVRPAIAEAVKSGFVFAQREVPRQWGRVDHYSRVWR